MRFILISATAILLLISCKNKEQRQRNSPLAVIVKIKSAESLGDLDEAMKYQNIDKLYEKFAKDASVSPIEYWRNEVISRNKLAANDKKFTNHFSYANYDIEERIQGKSAEVVFASKNKTTQLQSIIYYLRLIDSSWVLENINYKKLGE